MNPETELQLLAISASAYTAPVNIPVLPSVPDRCLLLWQELGAEISENPRPWPVELIELIAAMTAKYDVPWPKKGADGAWRVTE